MAFIGLRSIGELSMVRDSLFICPIFDQFHSFEYGGGLFFISNALLNKIIQSAIFLLGRPIFNIYRFFSSVSILKVFLATHYPNLG